MFERYFGLSENPFNLTPDPKFLYLSKVHQEALSHLQYGIEQRKGFVLITGEVGAGKTTICRSLLAMLPTGTRTALVLNPSLSDVELLQTINQDFGIDASSSSKKALLDELYEFLIDVFINNENAVLIIDECQNLSPNVLEQVRMLSNLETEKEKLLQILMIGQPQLAKMLASPDLKQIDDRIVLRYHLWPLGLNDTRKYINHRLIVSGSPGDIRFTARSMKKIHNYSNGIPRRINAVAERCLLIAYLRAKRKITARIVDSAIDELQGNYLERRPPGRLLVPAFITAFAIIASGIFWPSIFSELSEYMNSSVTATEQEIAPNSSVTAVEQEIIPAVNEKEELPAISQDWVIPDYSSALETLALLPDGLTGPDMLNLHPRPDCLQFITKPSVASVAGGYMVLVHATPDFVRIIGKDRAILEIPMEEFNTIYKWNIMINYAKNVKEEIFTLDDTGDEVKRIQSLLFEYGYISVELGGVFDTVTADGVAQLQEDFGLRRDGVVGPETITLISLLEKGVR
ncbi:MAG: AAA family ATPase [Deltaproteobacteria bacterium]|nr:AAA family ATPase [Deltaproteobacteria bacterium]